MLTSSELHRRSPTGETDDQVLLPAKNNDDEDHDLQKKNESLGASEVTTTTRPTAEAEGSVNDDDEEGGGGGGWFGAIGSDFKILATSIKDTIPPVIGGFTNFVHRVADEIAELERQGEMEAERWRQENYGTVSGSKEAGSSRHLHLPWELKAPVDNQEGRQASDVVDDNYYADEDLLDTILGLSLLESTFQEPFLEDSLDDDGSEFVLDEPRRDLIRRLLAIDQNLAAQYGGIEDQSPTQQDRFWRNYFFHCDKARAAFLDKDGRDHNNLPISEVSIGYACSSHTTDRYTSGDDDQLSLVPASSVEDEDASYVIPSAPTSLNTFPETRSVDDLVLVGKGAT